MDDNSGLGVPDGDDVLPPADADDATQPDSANEEGSLVDPYYHGGE